MAELLNEYFASVFSKEEDAAKISVKEDVVEILDGLKIDRGVGWNLYYSLANIRTSEKDRGIVLETFGPCHLTAAMVSIVHNVSQSSNDAFPDLSLNIRGKRKADVHFLDCNHDHRVSTERLRVHREMRSMLILVIAVYYPVLAAIGVPVNLLAIVILSRGKCGLSKCITRYLVAMATADLLVIVCNVTLYRIAHLYWGNTFLLYTLVCRFILFLAPTATDSSVWLTVAFTFDRFVAISCQKLKTKYCTEKTSLVIIVILSALFGLKNIPRAFVYNSYPYGTLNNIPWGCLVSSQFYTLPTWKAFSWIEQLLTPLLPFCLILLINALTVRRILVASRARRSLRDLSNGENDKDPEMKNRRRSIVLLFAISGSFILLWMTTVVYFLYYRISGVFKLRYFYDPLATFEQAGIMLQLLSSCTNTAIYTVTQSKFREELLNAIKYSFTLIGKLVK
ncbi:probable G-protein coupled receptor 139 [Heptranchias perlo]|uniref:probable G-protein coupled receptor 139 n=1 Tax=Heptranchias perlo TaxID=212740 RepID=UPI00355A0EDE